MTRLYGAAASLLMLLATQAPAAAQYFIDEPLTPPFTSDENFMFRCLRSSAFTSEIIDPTKAPTKIQATCKSLLLGWQQWQGRR